MRVTVVDPPAYTPPYDHALCTALAARGLDVTLVTAPFRYAGTPRPQGYRREESFYRHAGDSAVAKALQHPLDMARLARRLRQGERGVVHFQWLPIPVLDRRLTRLFGRPRVLTAHDLAPRGAGAVTLRAWSALLADMDAVVVHSQAGRERLVAQGLAAERVRLIPHGAFEHLAEPGDDAVLDRAAGDLNGHRVVLFFGLLRPYKGLDTLVEAFAAAPDDAVLLVVGMPRMPLEALRARAHELGISDRVRWVTRFVADAELPAYFRRADVVALPYRETEQSGVLNTALAFGSALVLSDTGGFREVGAEHGAARLVPPGDAGALGAALQSLLGDPAERERLSQAALRAAAGPYSWSRAAELTERLYRELLAAA
jgi:glycosyltransferase involved in cell wall biosynthesis